MIDIDEARQRANEWVRREDPEATAGIYEFDLGYVTWRIDERPLIEREFGKPCAVISRDTGELSLWPSLAPEQVAEFYRVHTAATRRFPADIRALLRLGGWRPGRDVSGVVGQWWRNNSDETPLSPAAAAVLNEFGGLRMRVLGWTFVPQQPDEAPRFHPDLTRRLGQPALTVADAADGPLVVDAEGRTYLIRTDAVDAELVTETFDQMLTALLGTPGGH
ncbi:hypothetical protein GCM10027290_49460 [Micromonospora sonneratiae]|uniref:SUKH-3 domain-containing protein n=1 Tax=Micromonospora sonneratiae TaxID=1184706 RepID=A0ABW3YK98_9ACTN